MLYLTFMTREIFHLYTIQRYAFIIYCESKLAYGTEICRQSIDCLINKAYELIYKRKWTL